MSGWTQEDLDRRNAELGIAPQGFDAAISRDTKAPKPHKYNARRKEVDGIMFDSTAEANRYVELKAMQMACMISDLSFQPKFILQDAFRSESGKWHRKIEYRADFKYRDIAGYWVYEDVKGYATPVFSVKLKMFRAKYPLIRLDIISTRKKRHV